LQKAIILGRPEHSRPERRFSNTLARLWVLPQLSAAAAMWFVFGGGVKNAVRALHGVENPRISIDDWRSMYK
jgi:hypothetical protein